MVEYYEVCSRGETRVEPGRVINVAHDRHMSGDQTRVTLHSARVHYVLSILYQQCVRALGDACIQLRPHAFPICDVI